MRETIHRHEMMFADITVTDGTFSAVLSYWISAKYTDTETGLLYYGFRYYQPSAGRWLSREPAGEDAGENLYLFCDNTSVGGVDHLGLWPETSSDYRAQRKEKDYRVARKYISGKFAELLLKHYIWGNGQSLTLSEDAVRRFLVPQTTLLASEQFRSDLQSAKGCWCASYSWQTRDYTNPSGGLGTYTVRADVCIDLGNGSTWQADGKATVEDAWDFNWEWGRLIRQLWFNLNNDLPILSGREPRTAAGSLIDGEKFDIRSVPVRVTQQNTRTLLQWRN